MTADAMGGVWTYAMELADALTRRGHDVALAVMGAPPSPEQRAHARAAGARLHVGPYKLEWMQDPWSDVARAGEWLMRLERAEAPDVVHLNGYVHADLPWRARTLCVAHSCVLSWWDAVHGGPPPDDRAEYRRRVARGLRAADLLVAPTHAMLSALVRHYGPLDPPGRVILNGRDPAAFAPATKEPFVLGAGRLWDPAKDVSCLDAAARGAPWPVFVAGDARHPETGETVALWHARALGRVDDGALRDLYGRASVYALPARYEPFGLGALEAALSGCALALADIPSLREVWGDAALYAPPGDAAALAAVLRRYATSDPLRARMARKAARRALRYTSAAMTDAYLDAYGRLGAPRAPLHDPTEVTSCAS